MTKVIAITNQKGGVGKTTTAINLAASLVATKMRVCLMDLDPQGNATMGSGIHKNALTLSSNDLLLGKAKIDEVMLDTTSGYTLVPANSDLTEAEVLLLDKQQCQSRLRQILMKAKNNFDFVLIDCPPSLSMLTVNALVAAESVLIPMQCEYFALEGLAGLIETIDRIRDSLNGALHIEGLLRTMYDARNRLCLEVSKQLLSHFGDQVYRTVIPRNVRLAEAPSHGLPVLMYDKSSQGAAAYLVLAGEILRKQKLAKEKIESRLV